jgi:hypothetical protein
MIPQNEQLLGRGNISHENLKKAGRKGNDNYEDLSELTITGGIGSER